MKKFIVVCTLLCTGFLFSQENITKDLDEFHEIKVYDGLSVNIIKSDKNQAIISGKNADEVVIINKNDKLKIRMNINEVFNGYTTFIVLYTKEVIDVIDVNEKAFVAGKDTFSQVDFELRAQEGGEIDVNLDVQRLESKAVTGGIITVKGKASIQEIDINTGGKFEGEDLKTQQTSAVVKAGGIADVNASDYVSAKVKVGGTINVYGNPKVLEKQTFVGGNINEH